MKILVTGGAGFIGSHIVDQLIKKRHKVVVVDDLSYGKKKNIHAQAKFYELDIQSSKIKKIFHKHKFDLVMHLAAQKNVRASVDDPVFDARVNILGSLNILENARKFKVKKFIFSSSGGAIYGDTELRPTPEDFFPHPISPYGITKFCLDNYLHYYKTEHGLDYVSLRLANVYGPRQDPKGEAGVVAIFISRILAGKQPIINGPGTQTRDYVYVEDVARAFIKSIDKHAQGIYNVGTGREVNVNQLFQQIIALMKVNIPEKHGPVALGEQQTSSVKITKIKKDLNWKPQYNLKKGLIKTINWFKKNK